MCHFTKSVGLPIIFRKYEGKNTIEVGLTTFCHLHVNKSYLFYFNKLCCSTTHDYEHIDSKINLLL